MEKISRTFSKISLLAEHESWRKEVYRPLSYMHKWWARRLGSIFRGLLISDNCNYDLNIDTFYNYVGMAGITVFDPFMGSGTTITEAAKLNANVIGCDINPVAANLVCTALTSYNQEEVISEFKKIEYKCKESILSYYRTVENGQELDVLYYFWVHYLSCDDCGCEIPLFKNFIFSKNAYPAKKPTSQSVCPNCGEINECHYQITDITCRSCQKSYNPQNGFVNRNNIYTCPICGKKEKVVEYIRRHKSPLMSKMYAKMVICDGVKSYLKITDYDLRVYKQVQNRIKDYEDFIPFEQIQSGINTNQILNYEYKYWKDMFNARQLLSICIIEKAIKEIEDEKMRMLFGVLLSGTLEFNNMFCSFKGEGTGAVRPLFYNHILKPELAPLEANVWGLKTSSGAFSTLFETRILRTLDYKEHPYEILINDNKKAERFYLEGCKLEKSISTKWENFDVDHPLILCQDSSTVDIPKKSVDLVLTDPPFFDNVNYSELADFFYVWQKKMSFGYAHATEVSTRNVGEVQDSNATAFGDKLLAVFTKCCEVLRDNGRLVFTYHHSRADGWIPVFNAIDKAGFIIDLTFLVKAEMAVSVTILAAKEPINYDLVFVCSKREQTSTFLGEVPSSKSIIDELEVLENEGLKLSNNDKQMLLYGKALCLMSREGKHDISIKDIINTVEILSNDAVLCK